MNDRQLIEQLDQILEYLKSVLEISKTRNIAPSDIVANYEFKKFGQIPMNENKILFSINNVIEELGGEKQLLLVFDSLTDIILWLEFNTAYKFMRKAISKLRRAEQVSSIFLINKKSHSDQVLSSFESLFDGVLESTAKNTCTVKGIIKFRYIIH